MGFFLRKSISLGPIRFNLSKSGIGVSAGIKGLRIGAGPRGNYVHMGREGLYYRKTFSSRPVRQLAPSSTQPTADVVVPAEMDIIESSAVSQMTDCTATELLEELNGKHEKVSLWKIMAAACIIAVGGAVVGVPVFMINFGGWVIAAAVLTIILTYWYDQFRKTTVLFYDFEPEAETRYQALHEGFEKLKFSARTWHIIAKAEVTDSKYHAGAANLISRDAVVFSMGTPPYMKTNIKVLILPCGKQTLYFFPERVLVYDGGKIGAVSYNDLEINISPTRFIEEESLPFDAKIVDRTWRYTNKSGGPDKRFKDNPEIPIVLYDRLMLTSSSGLKEYFDVSALGASAEFAEAVKKLAA